MEFFMKVIEDYVVGTLVNLFATGILHRVALKISSCLLYESLLVKFLKKLKEYTKYAKYIMWVVSSDYCIAKFIKNKIKLTNYLDSSGQEDKKNDWRKNEKEDEKKLRFFIQISNGLNLIFSLVLIIIFFISANLKINYMMFCFILIRAISRSVEICYAFTKDVIKKANKNTKLNSGDRIILGISSYIEVILNYTLVYYILSQFGNVPLLFGNFCDYKKISSAFFRSVGISTFTGISVGNLDVYSVVQLFTSLSLVYFAFASYIGNINSKNDDEKRKAEESKLEEENTITQTKKIKKHNRKDILFGIAIVVAAIIVLSPIILKASLANNFISWAISALKQQGYKSSYFEVTGTFVGSFLAITGALWTQRRIDENKEKQEEQNNSLIIFYDLKSIEYYLKYELEPVNIRYLSEWQKVLSKCTLKKKDDIEYIYNIYDNVYNYNYKFNRIEKLTPYKLNKDDIDEYKKLKEFLYDSSKGCINTEELNSDYKALLGKLNNK